MSQDPRTADPVFLFMREFRRNRLSISCVFPRNFGEAVERLDYFPIGCGGSCDQAREWDEGHETGTAFADYSIG